MSVSVNEFWNRLASSGIADAAQCRAMAVAYAQSHGGSPPGEAPSLARHLVQNQRLTRYQAEALLAGETGRLQRGDFVISEPMSQAPFQGWYWGHPRGSEQPVALLYPVDAGAPLQGGWLLSHEKIAANHLQPITLHHASSSSGGGSSGAIDAIVSPLPAGQSLAQQLKKQGRLDEATVRRIGLAIGQALQGLQQGGISHGALHPERVWIGDDPSIWLLRDASGPPAGPFEDHQGWFRPLTDPALYAAPEFSLPGQVPDPLTDQYALGCLLWHARSGQPPFAPADTDALLRQHTMERPEPLRQAVQAGAAGNPLLRIIAHAMSKNAEGRFPDLSALMAAIQASEAVPATTTATANKRAAPAAGEAKPRSWPKPAPPETSDNVAAATPGPGKTTKEQAPTQDKKRVQPAAEKDAVAVTDSQPNSTRQPPGTAVVAEPREPFVVASDTPRSASPRSPQRRKKKKKNKRAPLVLGALGFLVMVLMVLVLVTQNGNETAPDESSNRPPVAYRPPPSRPAGSSTPESNQAKPVAGVAAAYDLVDDAQALWVPPSAAGPPPLRLIPPGPQMVVSLRLRQLHTSSAGQQMLAALEQELSGSWQALQQRTGIPAEQIERLTLALEGGGDGRPAAALGVELTEAIPLGELQQRWGVEPARTPQGTTLFAGEEAAADAYFVPGDSLQSDTPVTAFAVGSLDQIKLVAEVEGGPIPLPRHLERLWQAADAKADMIVMGTPNFLFADGRQMLDRYASQWVESFKQFLLPDVVGLMASTTLQPDWYVELRLAPGGGTSAVKLTKELQTAVAQFPSWAERFLVESSPHESWKPLAIRLPQMMFAVTDQARFGISDDQAVGNLYLPAIAAPNVSLAALLAANTPADASRTAAKQTGQPPPLSIEEMLERPMSIRFDQESLERAANAVLDEFASDLPANSTAPPIFVLGKDLEKEGITQNQQIRDFDLSEQSLRSVLTELVMRANPVTTVQAPSEEDQKLVWVVGPNPDQASQQAILITTRAAAQERYTLPSEFVAP